MTNLTAIVIGATGATGKELVSQLLENPNYGKVKIIVRKATGLIHPKLETHVVDFEELEKWSALFTGDVLFSALGTTLKQAGSKKNQYQVDFNYQFLSAKMAAENGVTTYVLVSSYGAKSNSLIFYSKMKGELEEAVKKLNFKKTHLFQPGILDRSANADRFMERLSVKIIRSINKIGLLKTQRPMPVSLLAEKMIKVTLLASDKPINYHALDAIFTI